MFFFTILCFFYTILPKFFTMFMVHTSAFGTDPLENLFLAAYEMYEKIGYVFLIPKYDF